MTPQEQEAAKRLRWDGTITAGNALTFASMVLMLVVWGVRLEGRVDRSDERQARYELVSQQIRTEDREAAAVERADVRASLRRIEDYLLRITPSAGTR